jgi:DNA mismatch repair protein MutS
MRETTPMMAQYRSLKARYSDALLFFRLGDFYEMFFEDAEIGSRELGIALTGRGAGEGKRAPMCGVPHHSVHDYIKVLIEKGYKVALCEQLEDPALSKGLVRRDVVRVITPGTYWEGSEESGSSYIAAIAFGSEGREDKSAFCACDLSTGEVLLAEFEGCSDTAERPHEGRLSGSGYGSASTGRTKLFEELGRLSPKECVITEDMPEDTVDQVSRWCSGACISAFSFAGSAKYGDEISSIYGQDFSSELAARGRSCALKALSMLLTYLKETQMVDLGHLKAPVFYLEDGYLEIDPSTKRNLELLERLQGGKEGSLMRVLDRTCTSMGSRLLRHWIERPLSDSNRINERLQVVDRLFSDSGLRATIRKGLSRVKDLERLVTKIAYKSCNARDLVSIASSLEAVPDLARALEQATSVSPCAFLARIAGSLDPVPEASDLIRKAIVDDPPLSVTDGGVVRKGYDPSIDELRDLAAGGKRWVLDLEARERERTGVKSLKVGYNRVFGYYIEVTKANLSSVPENYIRKQTLVSAERYVTQELREKEAAILGAEERLNREEYRVFSEVRDFVESRTHRIQATAQAIAVLDVLASFAEVSVANNYCRPKVSQEGDIIVKDGRHPVLEQVIPPGSFVPNDLKLDDKERILIITGPNMGGKSTYCRQAALCVIMAQMGCYVPAKSAKIGCVDKVFARVGAYDDLVLGQSTFMVEMSEVSRILRNATDKSLVILDEIGRGTSTFDGLAVAWAVVEFLAGEAGRKGTRALVATHYRELTLLSDLKPNIHNYSVAVKKAGEEIVFLRRVGKGVAEGSFGIDVSRMAGLPENVVLRAREILAGLEAEARRGSKWRTGILGQVASRSSGPVEFHALPGQATLFGGPSEAAAGSSISPGAVEIVEELEALDVDRMSPLEALEKLYALKKRLQEER